MTTGLAPPTDAQVRGNTPPGRTAREGPDGARRVRVTVDHISAIPRAIHGDAILVHHDAIRQTKDPRKWVIIEQYGNGLKTDIPLIGDVGAITRVGPV